MERLMCKQNSDFNILIVADLQAVENKNWVEAKCELEQLLCQTNPDFVMILGDIQNDNIILKGDFDVFVSPLVARNIPFTTVNGNHDPYKDESYAVYSSYPLCYNNKIESTSPYFEKDRPVNYYIPVYSSDGTKILFAIYGMDSGVGNHPEWEGFTAKQIEWYRETSDKIKALNGGMPVTSLMCCHIPFNEVLDMEVLSGVVYEEITCTSKENNRGIIDAIKEQGDVKMAVFGHSHNINRAGIYNNIMLCYAGKISNGSYNHTETKGARLVTFNPEKPSHIKTKWISTVKDEFNMPEHTI